MLSHNILFQTSQFQIYVMDAGTILIDDNDNSKECQE